MYDDDPDFHHEHATSGAELLDMVGDLGTCYAECPCCGCRGSHAGFTDTNDGKILELVCSECYYVFDAP